MDLDAVEVEAGEAVAEAVTKEKVAEVEVVAAEVKMSLASVVGREAISALSAQSGTPFATSASSRTTFSRCVSETSRRMAETEEEAPVVDTVDMVENLNIKKPENSRRGTARL